MLSQLIKAAADVCHYFPHQFHPIVKGAVSENHITLGMGYDISSRREISGC